MKRIVAVIVLHMISLGASAQAPAGPAGAPDGAAKANAAVNASGTAGSVARGKQLYQRGYCFECHGEMGQGVPQAGPRIGPPERTLPDFIQFVRAPIGDMAPISPARVSDAELADIYAYLRTLHPPAKAGAPPRATKSPSSK